MKYVLTEWAMASSDLRWTLVGSAVGGRISELDRAGVLFRFGETFFDTCSDDKIGSRNKKEGNQ